MTGTAVFPALFLESSPRCFYPRENGRTLPHSLKSVESAKPRGSGRKIAFAFMTSESARQLNV
jgi:hypothetical protein